MRNIKTIVFHPQDPTTDFLKDIYENKKYDVLQTSECSASAINKIINLYERVILLGHGTNVGLLSGGGLHYLVDCSHSNALRNKEVVGIFCYARSFMDNNKIKNSFSTGMFISEEIEAEIFKIKATKNQIFFSNQLFAKAVRSSIHIPPRQMKAEILKIYRGNENPVVKFNVEQITRRQSQPWHELELTPEFSRSTIAEFINGR